MTATAQYTRTAVALHWAVAAVILIMLFTAFEAWSATSQPGELYWLQIHAAVGVLFSVLIAIRILYYFRRTQLSAPTSKQWESILAGIVHKLMLCLIGAQLVTGPVDIWSGGWPINVFGWFEIPPPFVKWDEAGHLLIGTVHRLTGMALGLLVLIHIGAAFKHHFIDRDQTLRRMLGL